jgi:mannan endo-1,6-alpha-mannosidase
MAALEIVQSNLVDKAPGWASAVKGTGTSTGDVNAGSSSKTTTDELIVGKTTAADRAGAAILTALMIIGVIGGSATMVMS